ncbi:MFS transporter [Pseudonocardia sp.]|jgi:predicted MFS family arabinose efflux permease|uniref:MFS transporter n=1 Tax=Pseudonocardia sp. TaxID=60912 RepID=UPI00260D93ED|nr:MFS transporter [Pseudonocardia sp.]MCW2718717.1 hypothetical protein [Pseudonocardia sp.]MDT7617061.1 hypothetical protein [Pseudonocardiales bacterium]
MPDTTTTTGPGRGLVLLLAVVTGAAVANIYYAQPLLSVIGDGFGSTAGAAALLVTASQLGYAAALALVVPLGDLLERRALVTVLLGLTAAGLVVAAVAPTFPALVAAVTAVAVTSAVAQIVVPLAASLAPDATRGRVVGTVMSGLLIGILVARTVAGGLAELGGWRLVYGLAAAVMAVLAVVVRLRLPRVQPEQSLSYGRLLGSVVELVRSDAVLRQRMVLGALGMGGFTILWTALTFLLSGPGYRFGEATIGLFGLAGLAGAAAAPLAGRLADRGHTGRAVTGAFVVLVVSWVLLGVGAWSLVALVAGIVLLDLAQQTLQISHQSAIYARAPHARSRVTTAYIVSCFLGGAAASAATSAVYPMAGWAGVVVLGAAIAVFGILFWLVSEYLLRRSARRTDDNREAIPRSRSASSQTRGEHWAP